MPKYKVIQIFTDIYTQEVYKPGDVIEMTAKRANEAIKNLSKYEGEFLKKVDTKEVEKKGGE